MKYLDTKENSIEDSVTRVLMGEKLVGGQKKLDKDKDGDIDGKDFAMLRKAAAKKKKEMKAEDKKLDKEFSKLSPQAQTHANAEMRKGASGKDAIARAKKHYNEETIEEGEDMFDENKKLKQNATLDFELYSTMPKSKAANMAMNKEIKRAQMMKDYKTARAYMDKVQKKYSELGAQDSEPDETIDMVLGIVFGKKNTSRGTPISPSANKQFFEKLDDEDESTVKKVVAKLKKASQAHADQAKTLTKDLQDETDLTENFRKLAMKGMGAETKRDAKVGRTYDFYLPQNGDKRSGKIMRISRDGYEIMNDGSMSPREKGMKYTFKFYDPIEAKKLMSENVNLDEKKTIPSILMPMSVEREIEKMMKDRKYKGKTSAFDAAVKKKYSKYYDNVTVQQLIKKHAETNEGFASDAQRRAAFASGYKAKGKKDKKESYEIGQDYAKHTLEVTPGQDKKDVDEMLGIANKKNMTMREALAKVWGINEGKSPFQKKEEMKKDKTMTGKKPTEVKVDPEIKK